MKEGLQTSEERITGAIDKAKEEYFVSIYDEIMEFQRAGLCGLMCVMKKKALGWKATNMVQNIHIVDSKENIIVRKRQVPKIWENYNTELRLTYLARKLISKT
jgi:hypothetical protein